MTMRLADDVVLPFNYTRYGQELQTDFVAVQQLVANSSSVPSNFSLTPLQTAITAFQPVAETVTQTQASCRSDNSPCSSAQIAALNKALYSAERQLLSSNGLPNRPWYKNAIVAPGLYKGYGADTFPGLTQSIRDGVWATAEAQLQVICQRLDALTAHFQATVAADRVTSQTVRHK
eukprot:TRINITY_DN1685_c0_g2_i1.p1 TRINITY_DN1685_c0_g2~~TRINITY_DN1685_c0_g2_i1.p1  ORF type:complete len:176 (-),score=32.65 TRINITY_DN1685_c0_g2_i1:413-940(-)